MSVQFSTSETAKHFLLDSTEPPTEGRSALSAATRFCNKAGNFFLKPLQMLFQGDAVQLQDRTAVTSEISGRFPHLRKVGTFCLMVLGFAPGVALKALSCLSSNMRTANKASLKVIKDRDISANYEGPKTERVRTYALDRLMELSEARQHRHLNTYLDELPEALYNDLSESDDVGDREHIYLQAHTYDLAALERVITGESDYDTKGVTEDVTEAYQALTRLIATILDGPDAKESLTALYERYEAVDLENFLIDVARFDDPAIKEPHPQTGVSTYDVIRAFGSGNPQLISRLLDKLD